MASALGKASEVRNIAASPIILGTASFPSQEEELVMLSLKTLATFNMKGMVMLPFVRNVIIEYLKNPSVKIRKQAVETCISLLLIHGALPPPADEEEKTFDETKISHGSGPPLAIRKNSIRSRNRVSHGRSRTAKFRCETLGRILTLAIADRDAIVRKTAIAALKPPFDRDLAQVNMLRRLFVALNDEDFEIREMGIVIAGRLTRRNPAYIMPLLRKTLVQLLTELEFSNNVQGREESSRLLELLIKASKSFVKPYLSRILNVLDAKIAR